MTPLACVRIVLAAGLLAAAPASAVIPLEAEAVSTFQGPVLATRLHLGVDVGALGERARLRIAWTVEDAEGTRVARDFVEEVSGEVMPVFDYTLELPAGASRARFEVENLDGEGRGVLSLPFVVPGPEPPGLAGDLLLGRCAAGPGSAPEVVPVPGRRFGAEDTFLCVSLSVRPAPGVVFRRIRFRIQDERGRTLLDRTRTPDPPDRDGILRVGLRPSLESLSHGGYRLLVELQGKETVRREAGFRVDETRVGFLSDPDKVRTLLGYIAGNEELITLQETPDRGMAALWARFWERRDPDPRRPGNPSLAEFLRRVELAEKRYGVLEPGWRSDRGRTLIRFGDPDRFERFAADESRPAREIWYYFARNITLVFQDPEGFGRFRLVGSR